VLLKLLDGVIQMLKRPRSGPFADVKDCREKNVPGILLGLVGVVHRQVGRQPRVEQQVIEGRANNAISCQNIGGKI